jgi:hypothetical protein
MFRYTLRTLFIWLTAGCCFLGYELDWIRQRHRFIETHSPSRDAPFGVFRGYLDFTGKGPPDRKCPNAPHLLWLFGEEGVNTLMFDVPPSEITYDPVRRRGYIRKSHPTIVVARRLFPESYISADDCTTKNGDCIPVDILDF